METKDSQVQAEVHREVAATPSIQGVLDSQPQGMLGCLMEIPISSTVPGGVALATSVFERFSVSLRLGILFVVIGSSVVR